MQTKITLMFLFRMVAEFMRITLINGSYMKKLLEKLIIFNNYGYKQDAYDESRRKILEQAYRKSVNFTAIFQTLMGIFAVLSIMGIIRPEMLPEYIGFFTITSILRVYYHFSRKNSILYYSTVCRLSIALLLFFSIIESVSDVNVVATAMLALLIVTSTMFADSMIVYMIICIINVSLLIFTSFLFKSASIATGDLVNCVTFAIVSISIHYILQRERIEHLVTSYQLHKLQDEKMARELSDMQAANDAKSMFLSKMSHEIRTPINAILGMNEMIMREYDDLKLNEYTANIKSAGEALLYIISDILDFSKIEAHKMDIIPVNYELSTLINDIVYMTKSRIKDKPIEFKVEVSSDIPNYLYGDDIRIKQCVLNILINAVKYTESGSITFSVTSRRGADENIYLRFRSVDTGIGIKEDDLKKLFSPFERIEENRNRSIEGTGLGMNIVKHILALMDSRLEVSSVYGEGSDFSFEIKQKLIKDIPIGDYTESYREHLRSKRVKHASFSAPEGRILVIDDNSMNLTVITGLLKETQIQVDTVKNGPDGIRKVCEEKYDCIFIDHLMPDMDGVETLMKMRERSDNKNKVTPYIALTANAIHGAREEYLNLGFDDYISKPVNVELLEKLLINYLPKDKVILSDDGGFNGNPVTPKKLRNLSIESEGDASDDEIYQDDTSMDLSSLKGIHLPAALKNTGNARLLSTVITEFRNHISENADNIEKDYNQKNWENYTISVHALKSTSKVIGANELSGLCQMLETAGKNHDTDTLDSLTAPMLALYRSYNKNLNLPEDMGTKQEEKKTKDLSDVLVRIKSSLNNYDYDSAEKALNELDESELTDDIKKKLQDIGDALSTLDAEIAIEIIDSIL